MCCLELHSHLGISANCLFTPHRPFHSLLVLQGLCLTPCTTFPQRHKAKLRHREDGKSWEFALFVNGKYCSAGGTTVTVHGDVVTSLSFLWRPCSFIISLPSQMKVIGYAMWGTPTTLTKKTQMAKEDLPSYSCIKRYECSTYIPIHVKLHI